MKKIISVVSALVVTGALFAGGLVTNTNQSAQYIRLLSRNASMDIDAVYYNPAGLTKLAPGFHFGINNQTVGQGRSVMNWPQQWTYFPPSSNWQMPNYQRIV